MASLFGVFLYLGVMNLKGVQLVQRIVLFLIPEKYFPVTSYTEEVRFNYYLESLNFGIKIKYGNSPLLHLKQGRDVMIAYVSFK